MRSLPSLLLAQVLLLQLFFALQCTTGQQTDSIVYHYDDESYVLRTGEGIQRRISGITNRTNKDFVLGGLFPIHTEDPNYDGGRCGTIRTDQEIEAMLFALDSINADNKLLPNLTVGYDIRDTCYSTNIGLDEAIDLIVASERIDIESCDCESVAANAANVSVAPTLGMVGALSSRVSVPVANLGRLFRIPQISYGSTSPLLNNRNRHSYFYRTIPPDDLQAKAMVELMLYFNWTHISTIYSNDAYGQPGIAELHKLADEKGICIDLNEPVEESFVSEDYERLVRKLIRSDANVVVIFAAHQNVEMILEKVSTTSARQRFTWIASDTWARSLPIARRFNETVAGMFGVSPLSPNVQEFTNYLSQLTVASNVRNPWYKDLFAAFANCSLETNLRNSCNRNQSITELQNFHQSVYVSQVIDAVYTFAHALQNFLSENCEQPLFWNRVNNSCWGQRRQLNGSALLEYIAAVNITSPTDSDGRIIFNHLGNVEGKYELLNYQVHGVGMSHEFDFYQVGIWDSSVSNDSQLAALQFNTGVVFEFGLNSSGNIVSRPQDSQCTVCTRGQYHQPVVSSCCGTCLPCLRQNYSDDPTASSCKNCSELGEMWGNNPTEGSDSCVQIPETHLRFSHPLSVVVMIFSILGLLCTAAVVIIFAVYWKTPIIKSSGREQMILLLIGITLSFILGFIYVSPPVLGVCVIQRIGVWIVFSLMFGALFVKILRVARIFHNKSSLTHLRFIESKYQVLFTLLIMMGQIVLFTVPSIASQVPAIDRKLRLDNQDTSHVPEIVLTCNRDPIVFLVLSALYESAIIIASTILGVISFKYPANFNEAKFVSFCTFALLVFWLTFALIPTYFTAQSNQELQSAATSLAVTLSAFAVLVCLFGRQVFILVFHRKHNIPEKKKPSNIPTHSECSKSTGITQMTTSNESRETKEAKTRGRHNIPYRGYPGWRELSLYRLYIIRQVHN